VLKNAIVSPSDQVAGAIKGPAIVEWTCHESISREIGAIEVAPSYAVPADPEFTRDALGCQPT
jgi:hypothetical protein